MLPYKLSNLMAHTSLMLIACFCLCCGSSSENSNDLIDIDPPVGYSAFDKRASWSEIHNLIAYVHARAWTYLEDPDSSGIYLVNPDGTGKRLFLMAKHINGIDWSPDGRWIVAIAGSELWKISYPEGPVDTLLTGGQYYYPSWSPDGMNISYAARAGDNRGIYLTDNNGANQRLIVPFGDYPAWLHSDSILYMNYSFDFPSGSLCICDRNGENRRLFKNAELHNVLGFAYVKADIQTGRITCAPTIPGTQIDIWILREEQADFRLLVQKAEYPEFSPNGSQVVLTRIGKPYGNLWIINWNGTGLRELTESLYP